MTMTRSLRSRTGVFPGITPKRVDVLDAIVDDYVIGSFYQLADHWEFLGPWDHHNRILVDGPVDCLMRDDRTFWLYTDGASRENGARAAIGAVLYGSDGQEVETLNRLIGPATNNEAEYQALIEGLKMACARSIRRLVVRADSLLVVNQVRGTFKVKSAGLRLLHAKALDLLDQLHSPPVEHVPRKYNRRADALAKDAFSG